jgi:hypothetical protein
MIDDPLQFLSKDVLEECRKQLSVDKTYNFDVETEKGSNLANSTANKSRTAGSIK